jgi:hypothetical protein
MFNAQCSMLNASMLNDPCVVADLHPLILPATVQLKDVATSPAGLKESEFSSR